MKNVIILSTIGYEDDKAVQSFLKGISESNNIKITLVN